MMKLKQFMFALVAMMLGFALPTSAQTSVSTLAELKDALASYVQLPAGMDASNYESLFGTNTVTDGTNYYATLQAAVEAVAGKANTVLYCKPGADVGALQHAPVTSTLTVYGNGANVTGGAERDFDLGNTDKNDNSGLVITADMTLTVKYLNGCGAWGSKTTEHTVNLVFENCANMGKVFISGTTGTLNLTMTDCAFEGVIKEAVYTNADGAITLTNVAFSNLNKAINLNHKAAGTQTVTIDGCSFTDCGDDVAADQIPVRVLSSVAGGKSVLTVNNTTFTGTPEGGADILLDYGVGVTEATVTKTAANVKPENKEGNAEMVAVTAATEYAYTNVLPVAQIGTTPYNTLAAAVAAAQNGETIILIADVELTAQVEIPAGKELTLDLNGKIVTVVYQEGSTTKHIYSLDNYGTLTIKDTKGNGSINSRGIFVQDDSKLTVESGSIYGIDSNGGSALYQYGGDIVINGGHIEQKAEGTYNFAINALGGTVTVNGGKIAGNHGAIAAGGATVVINDGELVCTGTAGMTDNVLYTYNTGEITINGGTFVADKDGSAGGCCVYDANGKATINGGTFSNSSGGDVWGTTGTTIKGGTFENLTEKQHIADGYEMNENGEVVEAVKEVKVATLAELQAALADNSNELPIIITETIVIPEGETVVFDLNGKTVTRQDEANQYALRNLGDLTIKDTKGNGSINARGIYNGYGNGGANVATAKITVVNGTINAKGTNGGAAIFNYGVANIQGGTFTSIGGYSLNSQAGSSMTISDGVTANNGIYVSGATLVVNGGEINGNRSGCHVLYAWNSNVTIAGGAFHNNNSGNSTTMAGGTTKLTINGGTFSIANGKSTTGWTSCLIDATDGGKYEINGGEFKGHFRVQANCAMEINGGTFENTHGEAYVNGGTVAVKGGTFADAAAQKFATDNLAAGYELDANGTVAKVPAVAKIGDVEYASLSAAFKAVTDDNQTVVICKDVTEELTGAYLRGNITTENGAKVTITLTNSGQNYYIYCPYTFVLGENVTLKVPNGCIFYYAGGAQINGTVITNGYYQRYVGTKLTINEPGSMTVTSETCILRLTDGDPNAGIYVVGDNNNETIGLNLSVAYFYQGMINAKDANIVAGTYWQTNETDGQGSANLVLDNSTLTVTVNEHNAKATGKSTVTLKNGAVMTCAGGLDVAADATINTDAKSLVSAKVIKGVGTIKVDATEFSENALVIKSDMSGFTGTIEVVNNDRVSCEITSEGLVVKKTGLAGAGTEANPYLISSVEDLVLFRNSVNAGDTKYNAEGKYVALGANIDLDGIDWSVNIGDDCNATFDGIFDGKNFTISNLTATETAQKGDGYICTGLFGAIYGNAVVKNLTIENVTINAPYAGNNVAAVVGFAYNAKGSIENVHVTGDININAPKATAVGAIVGYDYYGPSLKVENCSVKGNNGSAIVGKSYVGGLVGYAYSEIALNANTVENVSVTGTGSVGAIAGIMLAGGSADGSTVKNVTLLATGELWANSVAVVAGTITKGSVTAANTTVENVTVNGEEAPIVGGVLEEKPTTAIAKVQAKIGDVYYTTFDKALAAVQQGETIVLLDDVTVAEGETIVLDGVTVEGATLTNNGTIDLDLNSSIATSVAGNGSIKVDATDITENVTVITGALSNFTGSIIVDGANYDRTNGLEIQTIVVEIVDGQMAEFVNAEEKLVHKFTYTRTLLGRKDSGEFKWSPLYLPVEIPVEGLLENYDVAYINDVHSFDKNDDGEIDEMIIEYIKIKSGVLKANYPYVIRPKNDDSINMELVLTNVELRPSEENTIQCSSVFETFTIGGTYHKMTGEELEGKLSIKTDGDWKNNDANNSLNPFRLYMTITREGSPVVVDSAKLSIRIAVRGEDDLTEIDNVPLNGSSEDVIFDLHGRRVLTPVKGGVYIINGKKVYFKK
ncbi:MAG: hypothetical protein IKT82_03145 [Bacteroidaceae bacterium]|nr:hypothetical protein [Bacteroidaceae bacterium]